MRATLELPSGVQWSVDFAHPLIIATRLHRTKSNLRAYFLPLPEIAPYSTPGFVGSIAAGGVVNCDRLVLYPHGNGTHTECYGHISAQPFAIADALKEFLVPGQLLTLDPQPHGNDRAILRKQLEGRLSPDVRALVLRTLPNTIDKCTRDWSGTNPPYLEAEAAAFLRQQGIVHLVVDLPSLDPERDGGALAAHRAFWNYPQLPRTHATITELCYIPTSIPDGLYVVQFGIVLVESDASPSMVVLYHATIRES